MPLPDANNYSMRIYELLKETDLENLSYAQFQGVAEKLFIEPENEDEMRRLVLVQLARMAVRGDWDGFLTGSTGTIGGSIADNQIAIGASVANTIEGSSALIFSTSTLTVKNQIELGNTGAAGILKNSQSNQDLRLQVSGTGNIRIENQTTNTDSQLNVKGNGTGKPIINLSNDSKAVSLECNDNQKLTVKGASNTFVLDASSATSGLQFPDGTIQTTAASGSGGIVQSSLPLETPSTYTFALMENLHNQGGTGFGNRSIDVSSMTDASGSFFYYSSFNASVTGTLATIAYRCTSAAAGAAVDCAIYDSDSDGNPQTLIGTATLDMTQQVVQESRVSITAASTGSMNLTKGSIYWFGVKNNGVANQKTLGYFGYESKTLGSNITGSGGSGSIFTGYNTLIGPATPPTTFSLLAVGEKQKMNLGGLYS